MRPLLTLAACLGLFAASVGRADDEPKPAKPDASRAKIAPPSKTPTPTPAPVFSAEAEAEAMTLVRLHLPELAQVLEPLKTTNPAEYRKAITELAAEAKNLSNIRARNPARSDLALDAWKARTRVELIAAQLANSPSPERESRLRAAIEARVEVDIRRHRFEADQTEAAVVRAREHLARVEANRDRLRESLKQVEANRDVKIEARFRALLPKKVPPTATKPAPKSSLKIDPMPSPALSDHVVPMPSPKLPEGISR